MSVELLKVFGTEDWIVFLKSKKNLISLSAIEFEELKNFIINLKGEKLMDFIDKYSKINSTYNLYQDGSNHVEPYFTFLTFIGALFESDIDNLLKVKLNLNIYSLFYENAERVRGVLQKTS